MPTGLTAALEAMQMGYTAVAEAIRQERPVPRWHVAEVRGQVAQAARRGNVQEVGELLQQVGDYLV
jgi:hypothetical protein